MHIGKKSSLLLSSTKLLSTFTHEEKETVNLHCYTHKTFCHLAMAKYLLVTAESTKRSAVAPQG